MSDSKLCWRLRLESLQPDLGQLQLALDAWAADPGNEVIGMAVIQAYEFCCELSRKTLKDLLNHEGIDASMGQPLPGKVCCRGGS